MPSYATRTNQGGTLRRICSAATEIAAHTLTNLVVAERDMLGVHIGAYRTGPACLSFAQHSDGRTDLSRDAVAALEGVVFNKQPLQRVQVLIIDKPLDRDDLRVLMRDGEGKTAVHTPTIKQHGTGAALPVVAAFLGAGELEVLAKYVQEHRSGFD